MKVSRGSCTPNSRRFSWLTRNPKHASMQTAEVSSSDACAGRKRRVKREASGQNGGCLGGWQIHLPTRRHPQPGVANHDNAPAEGRSHTKDRTHDPKRFEIAALLAEPTSIGWSARLATHAELFPPCAVLLWEPVTEVFPHPPRGLAPASLRPVVTPAASPLHPQNSRRGPNVETNQKRKHTEPHQNNNETKNTRRRWTQLKLIGTLSAPSHKHSIAKRRNRDQVRNGWQGNRAHFERRRVIATWPP